MAQIIIFLDALLRIDYLMLLYLDAFMAQITILKLV